jgi:preprotein translocase YajC subunit
MIRPQKKRQKELQAYRNNLQKGDKVVTAGENYGTIVEVKEAYVLLEVDTNVKIRVDKDFPGEGYLRSAAEIEALSAEKRCQRNFRAVCRQDRCVIIRTD